jgi:hypothetical protein
MPLVPFGEYRPDIADYQTQAAAVLHNVLPRGDGYGPFPDFSAYSAALPGACRGFFKAIRPDGSIAIFAATATRLYALNNTNFTWTDVSNGGSAYSALAATDNWQFAQFNNFVIAVQANVVPQLFDLTASSAFANLTGSPPQARYISVVGRFIVLSGLINNPYRVQWSGLDDVTNWTAGLNSSDFQDLPDGGIVRGVAGGEFGNIFQDGSIRRMTFAPGSPFIFQIERITEDRGLYAPYSLIRSGDKIFFLSANGFMWMAPSGYPAPVGKERVDRTFFGDLDKGNLQLVIGASDPRNSRVIWAYKSNSGAAGRFDKLLCYDHVLDRWSPVAMSGQYLGSLSQPGLTLENLDALAPTPLAVTGAANNGSGAIRLTLAALANANFAIAGQNAIVVQGVQGTTEANGSWRFTLVDATHIDLVGSTFTHAYTGGGAIGGSLDALAASLDSFATSVTPEIAAFDANNVLGFFRGANLEATIDTGAQNADGRRVFVRGLRPITDAAAVYGSVLAAERWPDTPVATAESAMDALGLCPLRASTRYARGRIRIPYGTAWSFATGLEPDIALEGGR